MRQAGRQAGWPARSTGATWGALLLLAPLAGALVLTWWLGGYALVFGVVLLVLGFRLRPHRTAALT